MHTYYFKISNQILQKDVNIFNKKLAAAEF